MRKNQARVKGARLKGSQIAAQSASGFVAMQGSNLDQIRATEFEIQKTVENIELSTADRVNKLQFQEEMANINSRLNKKIAKITRQAGIVDSVLGLATAGYAAYSAYSGGEGGSGGSGGSK